MSPFEDCKIHNGKEYRGKIAQTASGTTCQEWSSQTPHNHEFFTPRTHPDSGLERNVSLTAESNTIYQ